MTANDRLSYVNVLRRGTLSGTESGIGSYHAPTTFSRYAPKRS